MWRLQPETAQMLGPALTHLLHLLNARSGALTDFEQALHGELLQALQATPRSKFDILRGPATRRTSVDLGGFNTQVDLQPGGGWAGGGKLQTNCGYEHCPNKLER